MLQGGGPLPAILASQQLPPQPFVDLRNRMCLRLPLTVVIIHEDLNGRFDGLLIFEISQRSCGSTANIDILVFEQTG